MRVMLIMPVERYDGFLEKLEMNSRAFEIMINGCYIREPKGDHFDRIMNIVCTKEEAEMLSRLANRLYPDAAKDIVRAINNAQESPYRPAS